MTKSIRRKSAAVRFRQFRKAKGMTQKMLALCLGIGRREVIYIENGEKEPSIRNLGEFDALVERHKNGI